MASEAARRDALMGEVRRLPSSGDVAGFAVVAYRDVVDVLARRDGAVVARGTAIKDAVMRERCRLPGLRGVANVAILLGNEVCRALARGLHIIMTTSAAAEHFAVVELHRRLEGLRRVAALATVRAEHVGGVLRGGGNAATALVATDAGTGCALEHGVNVTALARHFVVLADELEPGGEVVEGAAHLGRGGRTPAQPQQPKTGDKRLQPAAVRSHVPAPERRCGAAPLNVRVE